MDWFKIIVSLVFIATQFSGIGAWPKFESEIIISCVTHDDAKEFSTFELKYSPEMTNGTFRFYEGELEKLKAMMGDRDKAIFFFLGHEDKLHSYHGRSFYTALEQLHQTKAAICTVSYAFLTGPDLIKYFNYFGSLEKRLPKVVDMASVFISNIIDSELFKIKLSTVYLTGFCLGGHIAGQVGYALKKNYRGQMVPAVWAFDPPCVGFSMEKGKPRRVQKGDGKFVAVFHTSRIGVQECLADVDIIVNGGVSQPGCQFEGNNMLCSHFAGFILRENIVKDPYVLETNEEGIPIVHGYKNDTIAIEFTNPPYGKSGIYRMTTGMVFDTKTEKEGFFDRFKKKDP